MHFRRAKLTAKVRAKEEMAEKGAMAVSQEKAAGSLDRRGNRPPAGASSARGITGHRDALKML